MFYLGRRNSNVTGMEAGWDPMAASTVSKLSPRTVNRTIRSPPRTVVSPYTCSVVLVYPVVDTRTSPSIIIPLFSAFPPAWISTTVTFPVVWFISKTSPKGLESVTLKQSVLEFVCSSERGLGDWSLASTLALTIRLIVLVVRGIGSLVIAGMNAVLRTVALVASPLADGKHVKDGGLHRWPAGLFCNWLQKQLFHGDEAIGAGWSRRN